MAMFSAWTGEMLEETRAKLNSVTGTSVSANTLFNIIPSVQQMQERRGFSLDLRGL